jgi:hypothetical protein
MLSRSRAGISPGARWIRTEDFREDINVEAEYQELCTRRSVTIEWVEDYSDVRKQQREADAAGQQWAWEDLFLDEKDGHASDPFDARVSALVRRAAEDGFAVRVEADSGWARRRADGTLFACGTDDQPPWEERTLWLERRDVILDGPLSPEDADPLGTLQASARETFERLCRDREVFVAYVYGEHPLLPGSCETTSFLRELARLRDDEGLQVEVDYIDDIGEFWRIVHPGRRRTNKR